MLAGTSTPPRHRQSPSSATAAFCPSANSTLDESSGATLSASGMVLSTGRARPRVAASVGLAPQVWADRPPLAGKFGSHDLAAQKVNRSAGCSVGVTRLAQAPSTRSSRPFAYALRDQDLIHDAEQAMFPLTAVIASAAVCIACIFGADTFPSWCWQMTGRSRRTGWDGKNLSPFG
jgi:hypothetical protein